MQLIYRVGNKQKELLFFFFQNRYLGLLYSIIFICLALIEDKIQSTDCQDK